MKTPPWDLQRAAYDRFKAFHMTIIDSSMVLFDTGEVIFTHPCPNPDLRRSYTEVGVQIVASSDQDMPTLYLPNETPVAKAWLDDNGMQYFMVDREMKRAVRISGGYRHDTGRPGMPRTMPSLLEGVPHRFQTGVYGYIGGPGCNPIGATPIAVHAPIRTWLTKDEIEHCNMIETTFRAAAKLMDHPCVNQSGGNVGVAPDMLMRCQTWQDLPVALLPSLYHRGISKKREFDWLAVSS